MHGAPLRERTTRNANVRLVQQYRFAKYSAADTFAVQNLLASGSQSALGRLAEALGSPTIGRAQLCAMMVGRQLTIDLGAPLSRDSVVSTLDGDHASNLEAGR